MAFNAIFGTETHQVIE